MRWLIVFSVLWVAACSTDAPPAAYQPGYYPQFQLIDPYPYMSQRRF
jgi:uncharacterized lipoprotein YmbA